MAKEETTFESKLEQLISQYDDQLLELVHQKMQAHNSNVLERRTNNHPDTQAVLDEAHALQMEALHRGQIHIIERHKSNPRIFFFARNKLAYWENGTMVEINTNRSFRNVSAIGYSSYLGRDGFEREFVHLTFSRNQIFAQKITGSVSQNVQQIPGTELHDLLHNDYDAYYLSDSAIGMVQIRINETGEQIIVRHNHREIKLVDGPKSESGVLARMAFDVSKEQFYISQDKKHIRKVDLKATTSTLVSLFKPEELATPIAVGFDQEERLLIIQDGKTKRILAHQVDEKISYPSFNNGGQFIEIPPQAFQSGDAFTYSCWLKKNGNRDTSWEAGLENNLLGLYIDGNNTNLNYHYWETGVPVKKSIPIRITSTGWFHLAWVKRGTDFLFYLNGNEVSKQNAPRSVDTINRLHRRNVKFRFSIPGYTATELRLWNKPCTPEEIKSTMNVWLTNQPENLAGYWRMDSRNGDTVRDESDPTLHDLSGHSFNAKGVNMIWKLEASPLAKLIPLYNFESLPRMNNRISIDSPAGHVYWIDQTILGHCFLMRGSTLGHTRRMTVTNLPRETLDIHVVSGQNDAYEDLILAHRDRRDAIRDAMTTISHEHELAHEQLIEQHQNVHESLEQSAKLLSDLPNNRLERGEVQQQYMVALNEMIANEKAAERNAADKRLKALEAARKTISDAHLEASEIKRKAAEQVIISRRDSD